MRQDGQEVKSKSEQSLKGEYQPPKIVSYGASGAGLLQSQHRGLAPCLPTKLFYLVTWEQIQRYFPRLQKPIALWLRTLVGLGPNYRRLPLISLCQRLAGRGTEAWLPCPSVGQCWRATPAPELISRVQDGPRPPLQHCGAAPPSAQSCLPPIPQVELLHTPTKPCTPVCQFAYSKLNLKQLLQKVFFKCMKYMKHMAKQTFLRSAFFTLIIIWYVLQSFLILMNVYGEYNTNMTYYCTCRLYPILFFFFLHMML